MKNLTKYGLISIVLLSLLITPGVNAAEIKFDPKSQIQVEILESNWIRDPSYLAIRQTSRTSSSDSETFLCEQWGSGNCPSTRTDIDVSYFGTVILPICSQEGSTYCIEKLEIKEQGGDWVSQRFMRSIAGPTRKAIPEIGYPLSGTISLFSPTSHDQSRGVDGYGVFASLEVNFDPRVDKKVKLSYLDLRVAPYSTQHGDFTAQSVSTSLNSTGKYGVQFRTIRENYVWEEDGLAGFAEQFSSDVAVRLAVRVPSTLSGWLSGRLSHAEFAVTPFSSQINRLVVGGNPVEVGRVIANVDRNNPPEFFKSKIAQNPINQRFGYRGSNGVFDVLESVKAVMEDKSIAEELRWGVGTYTNSEATCVSGKPSIVGMVSTNASVFDAIAPTFRNGVLKYRVGGLHFRSDGKLTLGQYDLVLRSDEARCLYGYSNAPVQATVSLRYSNGEPLLATATVNESSGWLHIGAYNFSFSNPTIEVRLRQETKNRKSTIICLKGDLIKKVTAINPKCPKGYKKK